MGMYSYTSVQDILGGFRRGQGVKTKATECRTNDNEIAIENGYTMAILQRLQERITCLIVTCTEREKYILLLAAAK